MEKPLIESLWKIFLLFFRSRNPCSDFNPRSSFLSFPFEILCLSRCTKSCSDRIGNEDTSESFFGGDRVGRLAASIKVGPRMRAATRSLYMGVCVWVCPFASGAESALASFLPPFSRRKEGKKERGTFPVVSSLPGWRKERKKESLSLSVSLFLGRRELWKNTKKCSTLYIYI